MHPRTSVLYLISFFAIPSEHVTVMNIYSSMDAAIILCVWLVTAVCCLWQGPRKVLGFFVTKKVETLHFHPLDWCLPATGVKWNWKYAYACVALQEIVYALCCYCSIVCLTCWIFIWLDSTVFSIGNVDCIILRLLVEVLTELSALFSLFVNASVLCHIIYRLTLYVKINKKWSNVINILCHNNSLHHVM